MCKTNFSVIDAHTEEIFQQILRRIRKLQSGGTIDSLKGIGADTAKQIGASYVSLKELAATYEPNEKLSLLLWNQQRREEQIVACLLFPLSLNKEKILQLFQQCLNFEIAGYLGSLYLYQRPDLKELADEWLEQEIPSAQISILTALARNLILYKKNSNISKDYFQYVMNRHYENRYVRLTAERYRLNT